MSGPDGEESRRGTRARDLLAVASLGRAHGLAGENRAWDLCPGPVDFESLVRGRTLRGRREGKLIGDFQVESVRRHQDFLLVRLAGVADRDAADALKGVELCLARAELPDLPEGWFWEEDVRGLRVTDRRRGELGRAAGFEDFGGRPQLRVERDGRPPFHIPWVTAFVPGVRFDAGEIDCDLPDGFPGVDDEEPEPGEPQPESPRPHRPPRRREGENW